MQNAIPALDRVIVPKNLEGVYMGNNNIALHGYRTIYTHLLSKFLLLIVMMTLVSVNAAEICEFTLRGCPEDFRGQTLYVPNNITHMSSKLHVCDPQYVFEDVIGGSGPPSVMFIIDNSASMRGIGNTWPPSDSSGARFEVTRYLLDTLYKAYPSAEVGIVVFVEFPYFDARDNSLFKPFPIQAQEHGAYIPLMRLDSTFANGTKVVDTLRSFLRTVGPVEGYNRNAQQRVNYMDLLYKPRFSFVGNTNINSAFDAAKDGMTTARYPKESQFLIFLSDGEPYPVNQQSWHGNKDPFDFERGSNAPTTFTVYFDYQGTGVPRSISNMTTNIRNNNYSINNPSSNFWHTGNVNFTDLKNLLITNVLTRIFALLVGKPTSVTVNTVRSMTIVDTSFVFGTRFPLQPQSTNFKFDIMYHLTNKKDGKTFDSLVTMEFTVVRRDGPPSDSITIACVDTTLYRVTVNANPRVASEGESVGRFTISREETGNAPLTVYYTLSGTASRNNDYQRVADSVIIPANQTSAKVDIVPTNDRNEEPCESVILTLIQKGEKVLVGTPNRDTVTICDNLNPVTVTTSTPTVTEGGVAYFTLKRLDTSTDLTVYYSISGTASPSTDYNPALSGTIVFPSGQATVVCSTLTLQDYVAENKETIIFTIGDDRSRQGNLYGAGVPQSATVLIVDIVEKFSIIPRVINNPVRIDAVQIPEQIRSLPGIKQKGALIVAEFSIKPKESLDMRGVVSIYDVVKNPVIEDQPMIFDPISRRLCFVWDGYNSNGRKAAPGTYLAYMVITASNGIKEVKKIRIGVKR